MAQSSGTASPAASPKTATDRVFVSPRVIDQGAFDDCAGQLRIMLDAAEARIAELKGVLAQAADAQQVAAEQQVRQRSQLELMTRLLKALTTKAGEVNAALERIEARAQQVEQCEARAAALLESMGAQGTMDRSTRALEGIESLVERGETMRTEIELSIKRLTMLRDDARAAARELAVTLGSVLEAMDELPEQPLARAPRATVGSDVSGELELARATLQAVTDRFRRDICNDLSKMAAAMRLIANRAETHVHAAPDTDEPAEVVIRVRRDAATAAPDPSPVAPGMPLS